MRLIECRRRQAKLVTLLPRSMVFPRTPRARTRLGGQISSSSSPANMRSYMQRISAAPTTWERNMTSECRVDSLTLSPVGWDAQIETLMFSSHTKERVVELVAPTHFKATLEELPWRATPRQTSMRTVALIQRLFDRW